MKQATSAGGIFVKNEGKKDYLLLLIYKNSGKLGLLKGHAEPGETIEQTALREVLEEAGLEDVKIIKKIGEVVREAQEKNGTTALKTIHIFLMSTPGFNHLKPEEDYGWFEYDEAVNMMSFPEEKEFLQKYKKTILDAARMTAGEIASLHSQ